VRASLRVLPQILSLALLSSAADPLNSDRLGAIHEQRVAWLKQRAVLPAMGVYQDFRVVNDPGGRTPQQLAKAAKDAGASAVLGSARAPLEGVSFFAEPISEKDPPEKDPPQLPPAPRRVEALFKQFPQEVFALTSNRLAPSERELAARFKNSSRHILARDPSEIPSSLQQRRWYSAFDWLCDPTGFSFFAETPAGAYEMGDTAPVFAPVTISARVPIAAHLKLFRDEAMIAEANGTSITETSTEAGSYRVEAWLTVEREELPWITSNVIVLRKSDPPVLGGGGTPQNVEVRKNIEYIDGDPQDEPKHKLDLFLPKDKKNFPVMLFIHGGNWSSGDRSFYSGLGYRFAKSGIGVAIPSYRLMPQYPHPSQVEDVAAAFAWVYRNIQSEGGDVSRIYVAGHSAGGHLAALFALDGEFRQRYGIPENAIHGVISLSGVYDVSVMPAFVAGPGRQSASPLHYVHRGAPPFLITYCQWDYRGLPKQARDFAAALKKAFAGSQLVYIPERTHISEIADVWRDDDPTAQAILGFIRN